MVEAMVVVCMEGSMYFGIRINVLYAYQAKT